MYIFGCYDDWYFFSLCRQIWTPCCRLQEDLWDMRGAGGATSSNSHRFVCLSERRRHQAVIRHIGQDDSGLNTYCMPSQAGSLPSWGGVYFVWALDCLKLEMSLSITSLMARLLCTSLTSRMARSRTTESKSDLLVFTIFPFGLSEKVDFQTKLMSKESAPYFLLMLRNSLRFDLIDFFFFFSILIREFTE